MSNTQIRCAIYTRKSSEEGLEQSFNSLDAQREAGAAYVLSQAHEGWGALPAHYDDGGYSGGNMERPGLQRLLADIDAGLIDIVVVYKIDRLTRSLADFSRIVERFEKAGTSFVSVTQSFNTTNSMGRLMLNVLLSFAQFEREVTGERIRDKIAASKAKGLWMGGSPPFGYDRPGPGSRILRIIEPEAEQVRHIFTRYLALLSVHQLQRELAADGIVSRLRTSSSGRETGGKPFARGALFHLLTNPIYIGRIRHKELVHEGGHEAIVDIGLFEQVGRLLADHAPRKGAKANGKFDRAALTGRLFDASGERMTPCFSRGSKGRHYRYYVSISLQQGQRPTSNNVLRRIGADDLERLVTGLVARWLPQVPSPLATPLVVHLHRDGINVDLPPDHAREVSQALAASEQVVACSNQALRVHVPLALPLRGGRKLVVAGPMPARPDKFLIAALRKAHGMLVRDRGRPLIDEAPASHHDRKLLRLAFLAPDIQRDILAGRQPASLHLERLRYMDIPFDWAEQRQVLGWSERLI